MTAEEVLNLCGEYNVEIYFRYDFIPDMLVIRMRTGRIVLRNMAAELDRRVKEAKA